MTRDLPPALADRLATGATTLARCWTLTRADGAVLGFTDHDRPVWLDGVPHEAAAGFTAQAVEQATGLAVDSHAIAGALRSDAIAPADLAAGLYDGAEIALWLVDWADPGVRVLLARGRLGEVRRGARAFEAEVAGLAEALNQPQGRAFLARCDRRLGDAACGVDLDLPAHRGAGTVAQPGSPSFAAAGLDGFAPGWFTRGRLLWTSGANAGRGATVRSHQQAGGAVRIGLWQAPPAPVAAGDGFTVTAGCDKSAATCRGKFANLPNFGGFPHMPGDDWAAGYPSTGERHDGGSLFSG